MSSTTTTKLFNSKTWSNALINQRIHMKSEYKNNLKRLRYLAEERHIQYREEYIQDVKNRIESNKEVVAEQTRKIREVALSSNKKSILEIGWDSVRKQMIEERDRKRANSKIIFDKKRSLESRVRREWLIEMNDKCTLWNKSPDEMKFSKYRLLNKKILERLPKSSNYILDRHEMENVYGTNLEYSEVDNYKGPLRSGTQKLAYILANNLPLPSDQLPSSTEQQEQLSVDPSSPEYQEYLEFVKYTKERQKRKEQKLRQYADNSPAHKLNSENTLRNHTHGYDFANIDMEESESEITSSIEYTESAEEDLDGLTNLDDIEEAQYEEDEEWDYDDDSYDIARDFDFDSLKK